MIFLELSFFFVFHRCVAVVFGSRAVIGHFNGGVVVIGGFEFVFEVLVGLWFVRRGSGGCDVLFAVSFLCVVERRRGLMLGIQRRWPSDACCCVLRELFVCCGGDVCRADDVFFGAARR